MPANRITAIIKGERNVTANTAIRIGRSFGMSSEFWLNLQQAHDLSLARRANTYDDVEMRAAVA